MNNDLRAVDLVVCDMAGTTVLDEGQVPAAFTAALAEHGVEIKPDAIDKLRGASKRQAISELLPVTADRVERTERVYRSFRAQLERVFGAGVRAVPGAAETLRLLRGRRMKIALNTGFDRDTTELLLTALGWHDGFVDAVVCGDEVAQGRPAPDLIRACMTATGISDPARVAAVGDTILDLRAGRNAGVRYNIGVLSGAHRREQLEREPHTHLIPSIADLPAALGVR
ncbi:MAG: phosphonatase-like hydrolase [Rhodospirillaceae bacterium]